MADSTPPDLDKDFTQHRFQDRVYIVTGGTLGIGLATVERLCNDGAKVAIFARNQERGKEVEARLQAKGHGVRFYSIDVTSAQECERGVQEVVRDFGDEIHGLVNSAGIFAYQKKGEDITGEEFGKIIDVNLKSALYMVKCCLPHMKHQKNGAIINISSIVDDAMDSGYWAYSTSKGGVVSLTKAMAHDLDAYGVRVNCVSPGVIWTPMVAGIKGFEDRAVAESVWSGRHIMKRLGEPCEVAAAIAFLLSRDASFITGARLAVDGGCKAKIAQPNFV